MSNYIEKLNAAINNRTITTLDLRENNIGDDGVKKLAKGLKGTHITTLNLASNKIGEAGIKELAQVLKDTHITTLDLANSMGKLQSQIILNAMFDNKLKQLKLVDNLSDILRPDSNDNLEFYINNTDNVMESVMHVIRWVDSIQTHYVQPKDIMRSRFVCLIKAKYNISEEQITNFTDSITQKLLEFIGMNIAGVNSYVLKRYDINVDKAINVDHYAKILSQCEHDEVSATIMKELLFHRVCIPETDILHPLVLKLLSKYDMPTFYPDMLNSTPQEMIQYYKRYDEDGCAAINVVCKTMLEYYANNPDVLNKPEVIDLLGEQS